MLLRPAGNQLMATVLVITQNPAGLIALSMVLQALGFFVLEAADSEQAALEGEADATVIDLVITDNESFTSVFGRLPESRARALQVVMLSRSSELDDEAGELASRDTLVDLVSALLHPPGVREARLESNGLGGALR